uniref:Uncharacterized protein n=1 Tax=Romanomermis culicivorax TaxID=13658 RepID=A0A915IBJ3_ROMCU
MGRFPVPPLNQQPVYDQFLVAPVRNMPLPIYIPTPNQSGQSGERIDSRQQYSRFSIQWRSSSIGNPDCVSLLKSDDSIGYRGWDKSRQRKK